MINKLEFDNPSSNCLTFVKIPWKDAFQFMLFHFFNIDTLLFLFILVCWFFLSSRKEMPMIYMFYPKYIYCHSLCCFHLLSPVFSLSLVSIFFLNLFKVNETFSTWPRADSL